MKSLATGHKLLFVVGVGRSGTTLMQVVLAAHPNISFLPEINFVRRFLLTGTLGKTLATEGKEAVLRLVLEDPKLGRLPYDWHAIIESLASEENLEEAILLEIVRQHSSDKTIYVGYKDALLLESAEAILNRWPDARIVHIYRDPRDVFASRKKAVWSKDYPNWRNIIAGRIQLRIAAECLKTNVGSRIHEVKYEDLLLDPKEVASNLCQFLDLEYSDEMLNHSDRASDFVFNDEMQWKKNLFSPLMKGNTGKWKNELTTEEIALVEKSFEREIAKRNYDSSGAFEQLSLTGKLSVWSQLAWINSVQAGFFLKKRLSG